MTGEITDPERWLRETEQRAEAQARQAQEIQQQMLDVRVREASQDGLVSVTVGPNGALLDLQISDRGERLTGARLGAQVMQLVATAQARAAHQVAHLFEPLGVGTEAMAMINAHLPPDPDEQPPADGRLYEREDDQPRPPTRGPVQPPPAAPRRQPPTRRPADDDEMPW